MRVWITGVGVTSALGLSAAETFDRLVAGERGLSIIDLFDTRDQRAALGAQVRGITPDDDPSWSRATGFAANAVREALAQARVDPGAARVGLVVGGTTAGMFENEVRVAAMMSGKAPLAPVAELRSHPLSSTMDVLAARFGPFARTRTVASACASGLTALAVAMAWLARGDLDAVVAGGTDALCRLTLSGFNALAAIDPEPCRPFDRRRRGLNLGEGAGFFVLERAGAGKRPIAELAGVALAAEAHHITNPESGGHVPARVMREALLRARLEAGAIAYVNAHGTGTPLNDAMEATAIREVFGADAVWVSSSKAQVGHTLAAAGAMEGVIATLAVARGVMPPTVGLSEPDPACVLRHVFEAIRAPVRAAVSTSFGFGGMDGAVVVTEPELGPEPEHVSRPVFITGARVVGPRGLGDGGDLTEGAQAAGSVGDDVIALDPIRARRYDRSARLCALVTQALTVPADSRERCGVVFGSAYSSVDDAALFVQRIFDKGPRLASPFDFPNLVPSSPVGHASIYASLRGPAMATADLPTSGESAVATAMELLEAGYADAFVAGAIAVKSRLIDHVFFPLFDEKTSRAPRAECAAAVLLEAGRGKVAITQPELAALGPAPVNARVFAGASRRAVRAWLASTPWQDVPVSTTEPGVGCNEAAGVAALAAALRAVERGTASEALVVGGRADVVYAMHLKATG